MNLQTFGGTSRYTATDLPAIDYLLITHDHWDHLDYASIQALKPKVGQVITSQGVGGYLRSWGYSQQQAAEELGAKTLLPAHVGKFALAKHAWDEPFQRIKAATANGEVKLMPPQIGEQVSLDALATARYSSWWE